MPTRSVYNHQRRTPAKTGRAKPKPTSRTPAGSPPPSADTAQRASADPTSLTPQEMQQLQRTVGNRAINRMMDTTVQRQVTPVHHTGAPVIQRTLEFVFTQDTNVVNLQQALQQYIQQVNAGIGGVGDPKINVYPDPWFGSPRVEVDYSALQLLDQYPQILGILSAHHVTNLSDLAEAAGHKSGIPQALAEAHGGFWGKRESGQGEVAHAALRNRSRDVANAFDYRGFDQGALSRDEEHNYPQMMGNAASDVAGVTGLLQTEAGVIIGEYHDDDANRNFLAQHLQQLHARGVTTIYLEAIRSDYQQHVDRYINGPPNAQMSPELHRFLSAKPGHAMGYLQLLQAIKQHGGFQVKGIDSPDASMRPYGGDITVREMAREAAMNQFATETIQGDAGRRGQGKYAVLAGRAHSHTQAHRQNNLGFNRGIPGLSQMLNVPAVHVPTGVTRPILDVEDRRRRY